MSIIKPLAPWLIMNQFPAFYDLESLTAIEQTAKLYGAVRDLIETYNRFVTENKAELTELESQVDKKLRCAILTIVNLTDSYITQVNLRMNHQDRKLHEAYKSFTEDITATVDSILRQMKDDGELDQTILDAIGNLNTKFESLQTGVADEQAALKADYEAVKKSLEAEYTEAMQNFDEYFNKLADSLSEGADKLNAELQNAVKKNTYFRTYTGGAIFTNVLVDDSYESIIGKGVPEIGEYIVVGVQLTGNRYVICKVIQREDDKYLVCGVGGAAGFNFSGAGSEILEIPVANIILTEDGDVLTCSCGHYTFNNSFADTLVMSSYQANVVRIDGLVLNGANVQ